MYLDKVLKALNEYDAVLQAAAELWNSTNKQLQYDYGNTGRVYEEKYAAGKALYDATVAEAKQKGLATVKEEFAKLHEVVRDFIAIPVPIDFITTLEAVRATGKGITEAEAEIYLDRYKNNYTAYRSLAQSIEEQTGKPHFVVVYDAIKNEIEEQEGYVTRIFSGTANGYTKALFMSEQHSPLLKLDAVLQEFITKDVGSYPDPEAMQG